MRNHKWQVWSKLNKKINEMLATFIYSIGIPVTRPKDSRVKNCHQFHHRADGGLRSHVKSCSLVFTRIRKLFKAETLIWLVKTWTWSQASLTFRLTAVVKHGHNLIFPQTKHLVALFYCDKEESDWSIMGAPDPLWSTLIIRSENNLRWKKVHFEGRVNYDGADALQRSPCRDRLSVPLCSALLCSFHPFLSADFRVLSYLFVHKYSCCFHLRGCATSRGSNNTDCPSGSTARGFFFWGVQVSGILIWFQIVEWIVCFFCICFWHRFDWFVFVIFFFFLRGPNWMAQVNHTINCVIVRLSSNCDNTSC